MRGDDIKGKGTGILFAVIPANAGIQIIKRF